MATKKNAWEKAVTSCTHLNLLDVLPLLLVLCYQKSVFYNLFFDFYFFKSTAQEEKIFFIRTFVNFVAYVQFVSTQFQKAAT